MSVRAGNGERRDGALSGWIFQTPQQTDLDVVFEVVLDRRTLIIDPDKLGGHPHDDLIGPFPIRPTVALMVPLRLQPRCWL